VDDDRPHGLVERLSRGKPLASVSTHLRSPLRRRAALAQAGLESEKTNTSTHDLGFVLLDSFGRGYRLTGDDRYRRILLRAAASLASRYDPRVGCIRSWNTATGFRVIIDSMLNLALLFWAAEHGGKRAWYRMAVSHALPSRPADLGCSSGSRRKRNPDDAPRS
jgi:hypothetical protein